VYVCVHVCACGFPVFFLPEMVNKVEYNTFFVAIMANFLFRPIVSVSVTVFFVY